MVWRCGSRTRGWKGIKFQYKKDTNWPQMDADKTESECEAGLELEPAIVGGFGEYTAAGAGGLVGLAEEGRGDVADDRSRVVVVGDVADVHRDGQAEAARDGAQDTGAAAAADREWSRRSAAIGSA